MTTETHTVGWIGVGAMGLPICQNLMKGGLRVIAHDVQAERLALARAAGAGTADTLDDMLSRVGTVCSMVFDDKALLAVVRAAAPGLREGMFFVDLSTVSPGASAIAAKLLEAVGARYVRAPVSGSVSLAEAGTLTVLGSGLRQDFEACLPVFEKMSTSQRYVGPGEAARVIKLLINMMVVNSTALIGEAIALGEKSGVDRSTIIDAINASIVGSRHYQSRADSMKTRAYTSAGPIRMAAKDLDLALAIASEQSLGLPMTAFVRQYVSEVAHEGRDGLEVSILAEFPRLAGRD